MKGWKRELAKQIRTQQREAAREHLVELRASIRHARAERKAAICRAKNQCRVDRAALRARLKSERVRILRELVELAERERAAARTTCSAELTAAKGLATRVARARAELAAERKYRAEMRRIEAHNRTKAAEHKKATRAERRAESDDEVRANIPETYVRLWERVKRGIKATPRISRTEAFMQYAEEHPEELLESIDDQTERLVRELEERERAAIKAERAARRARRPVLESPPAPF